jgi:hypothetical protein
MSSTTGDTFYLNTTPSTFDEAEEGCKKGGGHLAAFVSVDEQAEVEQVGRGAGGAACSASRAAAHGPSCSAAWLSQPGRS